MSVRTEVSVGHIFGIEGGTHSMRLDDFITMCNGYEIDPAELISLVVE